MNNAITAKFALLGFAMALASTSASVAAGQAGHNQQMNPMQYGYYCTQATAQGIYPQRCH